MDFVYWSVLKVVFISRVVIVCTCVFLLFVQAQFSQMRPVAMTPSVAPRMPIYPPGGPGIGQQIFYGQGPPAIIPSQVTCLLDTFV